MGRYLVSFNCLMPVKVDTIMEAEDIPDLISKLEQKDIGEFHFKTIGDFHDITDAVFQEYDG